MTDKARPEVLRKAADILTTGGWIQNELSYQGQHCAIGAVRIAAHGHVGTVNNIDPALPEMKLLAEMIGALHGFSCGPAVTVSTWNDEYGRTKDEVLELFIQAAEKAEADR